MEPEADPAAPQFRASEPRVAATPFGKLDDQHPLRRAFREIDYPANAGRVLSFVRSFPGVHEEQVRWLEGVVPTHASFDTEDDLVAALGTWGPAPPGAPPSL